MHFVHVMRALRAVTMRELLKFVAGCCRRWCGR
jgi:hypothetical protein